MDEIVEHYENEREEDRPAAGLGQLELVRTRELLELRAEAVEAGLRVEGVFGVEGMVGWLPHLGDRWANDDDRAVIVEAARAVETEPALLGLSAHLLLLAHAPDLR